MWGILVPTNVSFYGKQVIIRTDRTEWDSIGKLLDSRLFSQMLEGYLRKLEEHDSDLIRVFPAKSQAERARIALGLLKMLAMAEKEKIASENPAYKNVLSQTRELGEFIEGLYDYWRSFERYLVFIPGDKSKALHGDKRPYRTFNDTIEKLNHVVRRVYRDMMENLTREHPIIYRQVPAGCQVGVIAGVKEKALPDDYSGLKKIPVIRQVLINPPLIIDPPTNTRKGEFSVVQSNPLEGTVFNEDEWLCFPAKVGELVIYLYFHNYFAGLGIAVSNLFELCSDEDLKKKPDGVYAYGVPQETLKKFFPEKTVFWHDKKNDLMAAAIPLGEEFAYFGYIKKMMLTLYNSIMIKRGRMPVHGAMTRITMKNGASANAIIFGDTGTGKSESLEAFRVLSEGNLKDMKIVFDDMGSLELGKGGKILAYGTETGAFVRLDDLQSGYAFGNIDRSIIMSPQKVNARAVLPITTLHEVLHGWPVDYFLYANNYEKAGGNYLQRFAGAEEAMGVFREGRRMAKGTTNEKGIVTSYYANIFGPSQFREEHEKIARKFFGEMFREGIFVGQLRTQLGVAGMETIGPQEAAKALFREILEKKK